MAADLSPDKHCEGLTQEMVERIAGAYFGGDAHREWCIAAINKALREDRQAVAARSATPLFEEKPAAWLIVRPLGNGGRLGEKREVVLSPLTDDTFMDEGDEAWPLYRRADGGKQTT